MIPYFPPPEIAIGPFRLHAFGLLVSVGVMLGMLFTYRQGARMQIPRGEISRLGLWVLVPAFIGSAAFNVLIYRPELLAQRGAGALFNFTQGMSSFGGFIFAALGGAVYAWRAGRSWLRLADVAIQGLTVGWIFGRLGCTLVHDHPGKLSNFFLAFDYPEGARHNLGFYEFLWTLLVMLPVMLFMNRKATYRPGIYVAAFALLYGPARFLLDFLRLSANDPRYAGLTIAQYCCILLVGAGIWILRRPR